MLLDAAVKAFGRMEDLPENLRLGSQLRNIARFAEAVVAAVRVGDGTAAQILDRAARDLAELAIDAAALVAGGPGVPIAIGGGFVAAVPELAERLKAWFEHNSQYNPLIVPGSPTLDGCYEIAVHGVPEPFVSWVEELS